MSSDLDSVTLGDLTRLPGRMDSLEDRMVALTEANKKALEAFARHSDNMSNRMDTLEGKMDTVIDLLNGKGEQVNRSVSSVKSVPRATRAGRKIENGCVRQSKIGNGRFDLINSNDGSVIGGVTKTSDSIYEANVGRKRKNFSTMADVKVWASNLVYDGLE